MSSAAAVVALLALCAAFGYALAPHGPPRDRLQGPRYRLERVREGWEGVAGPTRVTVHPLRDGGWTLAIGIDRLPPALWVRPRGNAPDGHRTGDPGFDDRFAFGGHPVALGWLEADHRAGLLRLDRVRLLSGALECAIPDPTTPAGRDALDGAVDLALRLWGTGPDRALRRMAAEDLPQVRDRVSLLLAADRPTLFAHAAGDLEEGLAAAILADDPTAVRHLVASASGSRVAAFARLEACHRPALLAAAIGALATLPTPPDLHTWRAAIDAVRGQPRAETLAALAATGAALPASHAEVALAALLGFPATRGLESAILTLMPRSPGTRTGAAGWLARQGTPAALPVLERLARDEEASDAIPKAIEALRTRCGSAGGLSFAEPAGGQLSAAELAPERGAVSPRSSP